MPLSYSQLSTYKRCPKQYEYATVLKVPRPISQGESFGSSIHNTLKKWGEIELKREKKDGKKQLDLFGEQDTQLEVTLSLTTLLQLWRENFIAEGYDSRAAQDAALFRGKEMLMQYYAYWQQEERSIVAIEKSFKLELQDTLGRPLEMNGRIDRIERTEKGLVVIDYKSSAPKTQDAVDADLQLSIYALACRELYEEDPILFILLFLTEEGIVTRTTMRNAAQRQDAKRSIALVVERITEKDFQATPSVAICRSCPFRDICPARAI